MKKLTLIIAMSLMVAPAFASGTTVVAGQQQAQQQSAIAGSDASNAGNTQNITFNSPDTLNVNSNTTGVQTDNVNYSGTTTSNVNSTVNGTTTQNIVQSGTTTSNVNSTVNGTTTQNIVQSGTTTSNVNYSGTQTIKNVPSVGSPALTSSNDTCMGSTSGGIGVTGFGFSLGSTWTDKNCTMLKNSRELWNMGMRAASMARMCMDSENREALELTGFTCPTKNDKK
jgi:ABC-type Na+ efflux pump permease subunit